MVKRMIAGLFAFVFLLPSFVLKTAAEGSYERLSTEAKACIVMDADSGRILGGHNIENRLPMASTTKIMTALLTLEQEDLDASFEVDSKAIQVEGSSMGLQEGDQVSLRTLVYGMLLPSGNDAANAAAVRISGSCDDFVMKMNQRAAQMGLHNTQFKNPSGLDAEGHYSTALDMAKLTAEALKNETFREICSLSKAQVSFGNPPYKRWLENYNKLLTLYPHCIGVKTGFTEAAYRCLVSAAQKDGTTLICVTLNCPDDWETHERLYEHYFSQMESVLLTDYLPQSLPLANAAIKQSGEPLTELPLRLAGSPVASILEGEELSCQIFCQPVLLAPVSENQVVGEVVFYLNGQKWLTRELLCDGDIAATTKEKEQSLIDRIAYFIIQLF